MAEKEELKREFGVILEDINGKFDLLVEGQTSLTQRMDKQEKRQSTEEHRQEDFREETRESLRVIMEYFSRIDDELQDIRSELKDIRATLSKKVDIERLEQVERRVDELEVQLANCQSKTKK